MTCSHPPPLSEDDLAAALDGRADDRIIAHLKDCSFCRKRKEAEQMVEAWLRTGLLRFDCPSPAELQDYQFGRLDTDSLQAIEAHLTRCSECRGELEVLANYLTDESTAEIGERMPVDAAKPRGPSLLEILATTLSPMPLAPALRGDRSGPLVAKAEDITLFLEVHATVTGQRLMGQIVSDDPGLWLDALVEARQGEELFLSTVDATGGFEVGLTSGGPFELRIIARNQVIIVLQGINPPEK